MKQRLESDVRQRQIMERSLELFLRQGYEGTSAREIAEASGMSKANVYHHFPSKDDLLRAILRPLFARLEALIEEHPARPGGARDREAALEDYMDLLIEHRKTLTLLGYNLSIMTRTDIRERVEDVTRRVQEMLVGPNPKLADRVRAECALGAMRSAVIMFPDGERETLRSVGLRSALGAFEKEDPERRLRHD